MGFGSARSLVTSQVTTAESSSRIHRDAPMASVRPSGETEMATAKVTLCRIGQQPAARHEPSPIVQVWTSRVLSSIDA